MDISDVISFANETPIAVRSGSIITTDEETLRAGAGERVQHYVYQSPIHTDYLWLDAGQKAGITQFLPVDAEVIATASKQSVIGTSKPLPVDIDPNPSFPFDVIPYDSVTMARMILNLWFEIPDQPPLHSRVTSKNRIWIADHTGAFDLRFIRVGNKGISGRANLNLTDNSNRRTAIRLISEMQHGHFITEEEADLHIDDNLRPFEDMFATEEAPA